MKVLSFPGAIAAGMLCSLGAIALQVTQDRHDPGVPSPQASASLARPSVSAGAPEASVTEASPVDRRPGANAGPFVDTAGVTAVPEAEPPSSAASTGAPPASAPDVLSLSPFGELEAALLDRMNGARLDRGLEALQRYDYLDGVALARAESLAAFGYFDHTAPDGTSAFTELAARGILYRLAGENLARNNHPMRQTVDAAFQALMASPGHRQNILEPAFGAVGLAVVQSGGMWYHVMVFTNPR